MKYLITGAGSRLGAALAWRVLSQGHRAVLHYHRQGGEGSSLAHQLDAYRHQIEWLPMDFSSTNLHTPPPPLLHHEIDVLINNASHFSYDTPIHLKSDNLQTSLHINALLPIMWMETLLQHHPKAVVVNVLDAKVLALNADYGSYTLSKCLLYNATKLYAQQGSYKVYGVAPAMFAESGPLTTHRVNELTRRNPLDYPIGIDDVVEAVWFASLGFLKGGEVVVVDAGQHLMQKERDVAYE